MMKYSSRWNNLALLLLLLLGVIVLLKTPHRGENTHDAHIVYRLLPSAGPPPPPPCYVHTRPAPLTASNVVVAADGTGDYTTIADAVAGAPSSSEVRFVIRIKAGVYRENVLVPRKKTNIVFVGEGMNRTVLTSNRSATGGWSREQSATLAVVADGFVAQDMAIENSAGPCGAQAVALYSASDRSAFYRCAILGYQDTIFAELGRQFYRECDVYGTVDFVFGYASAVRQNCNLYARQPLPGQKVTFTAQGRDDHHMIGGIVLHNCVVTADLRPGASAFQAFLGRPWKRYSTTVVMQSFLGAVIDPSGWLPWNGTFALDTLLYAEFQNRGPGADTSRRVSWPGYKVLSDPKEARNFTVSSFINGDEWLPSTEVPYIGDLI